ncbi:hypothetical protein [Eleftheria terrae]|uniref:hypothetical protein n=1 Tax=Eleftheria terrae TaxID=1597781 RepID=UPI00263BC4B7|nr:hypothetical protein [Eleftheria terrae]WKB50892.1 hypothetical protein N7L95_13835 [Eleftheria terrae]
MYTLVFRRYAPFKSFGFGFEGDGREGPSTRLEDTSRTMGTVGFERGSVTPICGTSSGSTFVGLGAYVERLLRRHYSAVRSSVKVTGRSLQQLRFTAMTAGANPMVPGAPTIDTFVDIVASFSSNALVLQGKVRGDSFPNAEVFVVDTRGQPVLLFHFATTGGRQSGPFLRLAGNHSGQTIGTFEKRIPLDGNGGFVTTGTRR